MAWTRIKEYEDIIFYVYDHHYYVCHCYAGAHRWWFRAQTCRAEEVLKIAARPRGTAVLAIFKGNGVSGLCDPTGEVGNMLDVKGYAAPLRW